PPRVLRELNDRPCTNVRPCQLQWFRCSTLPANHRPFNVLLPPKSHEPVTAPIRIAYWRQPFRSFHCQPVSTCMSTTSPPNRKLRSLLSNPGEIAPSPALKMIRPRCLLSQ